MNKTNIEYCQFTLNIVTGCFHDCPYCYARRLVDTSFRAERLAENITSLMNGGCGGTNPSVSKHYPFGFLPTFHEKRLTEPQKRKKPAIVFISNMGDHFGNWVPDKWIIRTFEALEEAPQNVYLFLTKNPARYKEILLTKYPGRFSKNKNWWFGTTITNSKDKYFVHPDYNTWLSIEPILETLSADKIKHIPRKYLPKWVIFGAETGNRKNKIIPEWKWIKDLYTEFDLRGVPIFMKDSMLGILPGTEHLLNSSTDKEFPAIIKNRDYYQIKHPIEMGEFLAIDKKGDQNENQNMLFKIEQDYFK